MPDRLWVGAEPQYPVVIGRDVLAEVLPLLAGAEQIALIHPSQDGEPSRIVDVLTQRFLDDGRIVTPIIVPAGEEAKTAAVLERCWNVLGQAGFTRSDAIVAVGGGSTTDLAGFAAATWARGIRVVHVPTTVLAMVDATIGGKTGINTAAGKNLVGAFHLPAGVVCDIDTLATLPAPDLRAGLAEVVKVGFTSDPTILDDVLGQPAAVCDPDSDLLADLITRGIRVKAAVTSADFKETAAVAGGGNLGREVLNYGHTFGHAIEKVESYRWRHGDAVSVGMMYVAELANVVGVLDRATVDLHRTVLRALELPTTFMADRWPDLLAAMRVDKKARGATLRFVVLQGVGRPVELANPDPKALEAAYIRIQRT